MVFNMDELKFVDYIYDNIHGYIALTDIEQKIERLPIFQRLRRLKQLGIANWIFPGAEHTRYSHSLGVMHIADQMAIKLKFTSKERQLIRVAGMLHDIGHYPLSHTGESAYKSFYKQNAIVLEPISFNSINDKAISKITNLVNNDIDDPSYITHTYMRKSENEFHHEIISILVIKNSQAICSILNNADISVDDVCSIITGDISDERLIKYVQLMHSEFDADRIDYLLRDAASSGTSYGLFELSTVLKNLEIKTHKKYNVDIVGFKRKGIASMDQFLLNRYFAYSQVVYNKYVSILNYMAETIIYYFLNTLDNIFPGGKHLQKHIEEHESTDFYLNFTDMFFFEKLKSFHLEKYRNCPPVVKQMITLLRSFRAPKDIYNLVTSGLTNQKIYQQIKDSGIDYNKDNNSIIKYDEVYLTRHVAIDDYINVYTEKKEEFQDVELDDYLKHRLINGVTIINDNNEMHLLVDEPSSIIKDLCRHRTVFVRKYDFSIT